MLSDNQILVAVEAEADDAINYQDEIGKKREILLDYYNTQPFGDEVEGRSRYVSSDVADTIEWMLPSLVRVFTQGRRVAQFEADLAETDDEADQKTELSNYVFMRQNDGVLVLYNMFKDALLQYTGVVKVAWIEEQEVTQEKYKGLSKPEVDKLRADSETDIEDLEEADEGFNLTVKRTADTGRVDYLNIPPEEFLINRNARDFRKPRFIGHRTPTRRGDLIAMGFDKDLVNSLPKHESSSTQRAGYTRRRDIGGENDANPTNIKANDIIYLGEYYPLIDIDEDGVSERWQVFTAGNKVLDKELWDQHPFAVVVPVPMPHRAIGTCPAEQAADIQLVKSVLIRQGLDNVYNTNYNRMVYNDRVDLDDLFTPRPGGGIQVEGSGDVAGALLPLVQQPQIDGILAAIEYMDGSKEIRTGVNRHNQGIDADSLNKTATGFRGMRDDSMQRIELVARLFAETGVRELFRLTAALLTKYQNTPMQIRVTGEPMEIDPTAWRHNLDCHVNVGLGSGDRNEKIANLGQIYTIQQEQMASGSLLTDQAKTFNTLDKIVTEVGLKDASLYFNDPDQDQQTLLAENEQLRKVVEVMQQQANPLAEAEIIKAKGAIARADQKELNDMRKFVMKLKQEGHEFNAELRRDLTELELVHDTDVPGSAV